MAHVIELHFMKNTRQEKIESILNHLYWFKDQMDGVKDKENYQDFVNSIERLQVLNKED